MPQAETIFSSTYVSMKYYKDSFLYIDWKGYISVDQVKEACEIILDIVVSKNCFYAINDNRKVKGSWTQAIKWLEHDFMPRVVSKGIKKIAFLYSPHQSARYSVDRLLEVNDQYEAQTFDDYQEACRWLKGQLIEEEAKSSILVKVSDRHINISYDEIYYISRHANQSLIKTKEEEYFVRKSLADLIHLLPQPLFARIHKSHIVNTSKIKALKYHEGGYYHLFLHYFGNIYLTVGRKYAQELKQLL
ncbi:MAG: LytTR family DNA-binding domain-containing protein [Bacteroidota bacterium]